MKIVSTVLFGVLTTFAAASYAHCGNPCKPSCPSRCVPAPSNCSPCYKYSPVTWRYATPCCVRVKPVCRPACCVKKCWYDSCCKRHCKKVCY